MFIVDEFNPALYLMETDLGDITITNSQMVRWRAIDGTSPFISNNAAFGITAVEIPRTWEAIAP